ncbi:MAG: arabinofuranosyltransferase [Planctomycetota bacterium]|jgi:arabinofuranosyltransferase
MNGDTTHSLLSPQRLGPLLLALGLWAGLVAHSSFLIDDAFISFRYARNWVEWGLPIYNLGENPAVEGYSNYFWVQLLRLAYAAGQDLEIASRALSILASLATLLLLERSLLRAGLGTLARAAGLLALAAAPSFAVWSTGGLETALFGLLLFGTFLTLASPEDSAPSARGILAGLLALGLCTTRPEGFVWVLGTWACARIARGQAAPKRDRIFAAVSIIGCALFLAWRQSTYGEWLPNTVHAKAGISADSLLRGTRYVASALLLMPALGLALLVAPFVRAEHKLALGAAGMLLGGLLYSTFVGGDWMPFFRFLAPLLPFMALLIGLAVQRLGNLPGSGIAALAIVLGVLPIFDVNPVPLGLRESLDFRSFSVGYKSEWQRLEVGNRNLRNFSRIGRGLAQVAQPGDSIIFGAIGAVGWYSGMHIYDRNGLVDHEVARRDSTETTRSAGHDKRVPRAYFLDRKPTYSQAMFVPGTLNGLDDKRFPIILRDLTKKVFGTDPGEQELKRHTLPALLPLHADIDIEDGTMLLVLRYTEDKAAAAAFWQ